jgi:hypothetical protein
VSDQSPPSPLASGSASPHESASVALDDDAPAQARKGAWSPKRLIVQAIGAAIGIALLWWALHLAFSGDNAQAIERLKDAPPAKVAAMLGLSALSLIINGVMFWLTLLPLKRIPAGETVAANCIATNLSILPFKLSLIVRTLVHIRKHGVGWKQMAAWYAAFAGLTLGTVLIVGFLVYWWASKGRGIDAALVGLIALALVAFMGVVHAGGRLIPALAKAFPRLAMLSLGAEKIALAPGVVASHVALRVADLITYGLRFWIAAGIAGVDLTPAQGFQVGCTNMLLRAVAPAGTLGFTEAGTAAAGSLMGLQPDTLALLALMCTAGEFMASLPLAIGAWVWLAPHKLWKRSTPASVRSAR